MNSDSAKYTAQAVGSKWDAAPVARPDLMAIEARVEASYSEGTRVGQFTGDVLELTAYIGRLEAVVKALNGYGCGFCTAGCSRCKPYKRALAALGDGDG